MGELLDSYCEKLVWLDPGRLDFNCREEKRMRMREDRSEENNGGVCLHQALAWPKLFVEKLVREHCGMLPLGFTAQGPGERRTSGTSPMLSINPA
jgi:hypothetical protein